MPKNPLILLVDDEVEFLNAIGLGLRTRGFEVMTAENGEQALAIVKIQCPDVIIADLRMQPMNGFELYQNIKRMPSMKDTRFFFLTGMKDSLAEKYGLTLGAEAYFVKPVDLDDLETAIQGTANPD